MKSEAQIKKENEMNRNISVMKKFGSIPISDYLKQYIASDWNFLINGTGANREHTLYYRLVQLYSDRQMFHRPIIMITSENSHVLNDFEQDIEEKQISFVRPFVRVSRENAYYNPFLGMDIDSIEEVVEAIAEFYPTLDISKWNKNVFHAVCEILDKYGYELSLENLCKVFAEEKGQIEAMFQAERRMTASQSANNEEFVGIYPALLQLLKTFQPLTTGEKRFSMLQEIKKRKESAMRMPFFGFVLPDSCRRDFMEYLAIEIKEITRYCNPILVIDSVELNQTAKETRTRFFEYVSNASDIAMNLSGEACSSLIPANQLGTFIKAKGFRMCFTKGSAATEDLTRIEVGTYIHTDINHTQGKTRETFHILSRDQNEGIGEVIDSDRARISGNDARNMKENEAYFTYREKVMLVKNLVFK